MSSGIIAQMRRLIGWQLVLAALSPVTASHASAVDLIGYLPYYRMNSNYNANVLPTQLSMLSEIRYFGLTASNSGTVVPMSGAGTMQSNLANISTIANAIAALPADKRPRLDITLGGAGQATPFATISASSSLRDTFAVNIKSLLTQTGATSVDIDWEHPTNTATQLGNYSLMTQRIKQEIGASNRIYATMTPELFMPASAFQGPNAIDGVSLMTYDLSWWSNGGDGNHGEHSLPQYVTDSLNAWTDPPGSTNKRPYVFSKWGNGISPSVLGVGLPFYGRGLNPNSGSAVTYADLVAGGTTADGNYYTYGGQQYWTVGPDLVKQRVQFAHDRGLKNIIIWEIGQDLAPTNPGSLLRTAYLKNETLSGDYNGDGVTDGNDYNVWLSSYGATSGNMSADGNGDGVVDTADYTIWRDHMTTGPGSGVTSSQSVPEPATAGQLAVAVALIVSYSTFQRFAL
jgi:GH18 family chitinase